MGAVLELDGLEVRLAGRPILKGLTGSVAGRAIGLLGPNGAGKTTLLNTLLGFYPPSSGSVRVLGHDLAGEPGAVRALLGYMPENDAFLAQASAVRFVRVMGEISGLPPRAALERAHEVLFWVGLGEARYRPLGTYSLGMKQMAKLAQAIVGGPQLLLLDEPTNGLDPPARERMLHLIREIVAGGVCVLVSSHLLRDVEACCGEVLVLKDGHLAAQVDLEAERRANRRFLELEPVGGDGKFAEAIAALGCEWAQVNARRLKVVLAPDVEVRDLYRIAHEQGVQLRRLSCRRDSLEDIFLKAMENGNAGQ